MSRLRKWVKPILAVLVLGIAAQLGVSLLAKTARMRAYLVGRLQRSFGRPVEVAQFDISLLPMPRIDADKVTIGEDPAFGNEYFLRADRLSAGLRWSGLLLGRFELGTLSFSRPSLILVRNRNDRWNLEQWLPPAKSQGAKALAYVGPPALRAPSNRLYKVDIDDGRIDFKIAEEKLSFAFTGVSGSVEQVAPGRWRLNLEAQPWRSGATLQSAGTLSVQGDIAGTSARLQPAQIEAHWSEVSLADLFRLVRGEDYGLRGLFALDATLKSNGPADSQDPTGLTGEWNVSVHARASQVHRWDLIERSDNPRVNATVNGTWNTLRREFHADQVLVEGPGSFLRGTGAYVSPAAGGWNINIASAGVQASDVLAWYRAFTPNVDDGISARQFFTGASAVRSPAASATSFGNGIWPPHLETFALASDGGEWKLSGFPAPLQIKAIRGSFAKSNLAIGPFHVSYSAKTPRAVSGAERAVTSAPADHGSADVQFAHDFQAHSDRLNITAHISDVQDILKAAAGLGHPFNHGWDANGAVTAALTWNRSISPPHRFWAGTIDLAETAFQVAGLNLPLQLKAVHLDWNNGLHRAQLADVNGFGASWSGEITQTGLTDPDGDPRWGFRLHADHLDATDLDRWIGPRARPNWLQRLLPTLLGHSQQSAPPPPPSELLRRIHAEGDLVVDQLSVEKLKLTQVRASGSLRDLFLQVSSADAKWGGGKVHATLSAIFSPVPNYSVVANLDRVDLAQLPGAPAFAGSASGALRFSAQGIGRGDLLQNLVGSGELQLRNASFAGWDLSSSFSEGAPRTGVSKWATGDASILVRNQQVILDTLRLSSPRESVLVKGTVNFSREADLTVQSTAQGGRTGEVFVPRVLKISGPLEATKLSLEKLAIRQPKP